MNPHRLQSLLAVETLEARSLFAAIPQVTLQPPTDPLIGETATLTVSFDNASATDTGFGPYIDLYLPATGVDGSTQGAPFDGITFISATYLGIPVSAAVVTLTAAGVPHPFAVDANGQPLIITPPPGFHPGDQLVVFELPFGSYTPSQPPADLIVNVAVSNLADVGAPLPLMAEGGFRFGSDSLDNPTVDPPIVGTPVTATSTPQLYRLRKEYVGPESETAIGPNFERQYRVIVDVAAGQTLTNLDLTDVLSDKVQFVSVDSVTNVGAPAAVTSVATPSTTVPGGTLTRRLSSVTGTASDSDAVLTFSFFVPFLDAGGAPTVPPVTGLPTTATDDAKAAADWTPIDPRDPPQHVVSDTTPVDHTLTLRSLATQKSVRIVTDVGPAGVSPGDVLEYVLQLQVSDYFAFQNVVLTDLLSDGQALDPSFAATLHVEEQGVVTDTTFTPANFTTVVATGSTLTFHVTDQLADLGQDDVLLGANVPAGGTGGPPPQSSPALFSPGTTAEVRFRVVVQDTYRSPPPSGDSAVKPGDPLGNTLTVQGDHLNTADLSPTPAPPVTDDSNTTVVVVRGDATKSVYAINGDTSLSGTPQVTAGDLLTYRLQVTLPTTTYQDLTLTDFLPLPLFQATGLVFDSVVSGAAPAENHASFGPSDTAFAVTGRTPTVTVDPVSNSIQFDFGDFNDPQNRTTTVDVLFTLRVTSQPFTDLLYLTNQLVEQQRNSTGELQTHTAITQVQASLPAVPSITKGVVATDNPAAVYTPVVVGPTAFTPPGSTGTRFAGTITSSGLAAAPIDSNLAGVDAGDLVTFAIVVQNTGSGPNGAFDVKLKDVLPTGFVIPTGGAGLNLRVTDGTGAVFTLIDLGGGLFGTGIELVDPGPTAVPTGGLDPGKDSSGAPIDNGRNMVIVTYDLQVSDTIRPAQTIVNTATLFNYASSEGGPDFLGGQGLEDPASVLTASPKVAKQLVGTEIVGPNNSNTQAVIGEYATYTVTITVPEGQTDGVSLVDTLDSGLAYMDLVSVVADSGVTFTGSGVPVVTNNGGTATFNLGVVTNADRDNSRPDTIRLTYRAVVLNVAGNQTGTLLNNSARLSYTGGATTASAQNITVIEPTLKVDKTAAVNGAGTTGDAFDPVRYTVVVSNPGNVDAFDATLVDPLPTGVGGTTLLVGAHLVSVVDTAGLVTAADFEVVGDDATGYTLRTKPGVTFDFTVDPTRKITITVDGTLPATVSPGQNIVNTATVRWTSLDGDPGQRSIYNPASTERTGAGGVNDYFNSSTATIQVLGDLTKSLVSTSEVATPGSVVAIGEIARYRLQYLLPEGTILSGLELRDLLPAGLQFLDDGTAKVAFVSNGGITSSAIVDPAAYVTGDETTVGSIVPVSVIPAGALTGGSWGDGTDVGFNFGVVKNLDSDPNQEFVVVEFNALVVNSTDNQAGRNLPNQAETLVGGVPVGAPSDVVALTVGEPRLSVVKEASATTGDAGDVIEFTVTIVNDSGPNALPAFDVHFVDDLPPEYVLDLSSIVVSDLGAVAPRSLFSAGNRVDLRFAEIDPGAGVEIRYSARLTDGVRPNQVVVNTAKVDYTSLPGTNGTTPNPTGSTTPGTPGSPTGERTGVPLAPGDVNDYYAQDQAQVTIDVPDLVKSVLRSNVFQTGKSQFDPAVPDLAIGETVTFQLVVTLQEGTTSATLVDDLPIAPGLLQLLGSKVVFVGSNLSGSNLAVGQTGVASDRNGDGLADRATFNFGTVVNHGDNVVDDRDRIVVEVTALVPDVAQNVSGLRLTNTGTLDYQSGVATSTADVEIVEPDLNLTKTVTPSVGDAGDVFDYTLTVAHTAASTAAAFDLSLIDVMGPNLDLVVGSVTSEVVVGAATSSLGRVVRGNAAGESVVLVDLDTLPLGAVWIVHYQAKLGPGVPPLAQVPNLGYLHYDSFPGPGGRKGYDLDLAVVTVPGYSIEKEILATSFPETTGTDVAIGETVTYGLVVTLPEGTTTGLVVTDFLPAGMTYVPGSVAIGPSGFVGSVATPSTTVSGNQLRFDFSTPIVVTPDNDPATNSFVLTFQATVDDVPGNVGFNPPGQTVLPNTAQAQVLDGPIETSNEVDVVVVEPQLQIDKSVDDSTVDGGQIVTYTVDVSHTAASTGPAYDVVVGDPLAAGLELVVGSVTTDRGAVVSGNTLGDTTVQVDLSALAVGETMRITYQARIAAPPTVPAPQPGDSLTNTVVVDYDGTPGPGGRPGTDSDDAVVTLDSNGLSGKVWVDLIYNNAYDPGEPLLSGVTINLSGFDNLGNAVSATTTTDANGAYQFLGLRPGDYLITEVQPPFLLEGSALLGSPFGVSVIDAHNLTAFIPAGSNDTGLNFDFTALFPNALAGSVYQDFNNDGVRQFGEPGIGGVTILLTGTDDLGPVSLQTTTLSNGLYLFRDLRPGTYTITEIQPAAFIDGKDRIGTLGGQQTQSDVIFDVVLQQAQIGLLYDFGELPPGSISGSVYADLNMNFVRDPGEPGIGGTTVDLVGVDDLNQSVTRTLLTQADGTYTFDMLRPGTYSVVETQPPGYFDGEEHLGTVGGASSGVVGDDRFDEIVIPGGGAGPTRIGVDYDFGEYPPGGLSGSVYIDSNNDGIRQPGEAGIPEVVVTLSGVDYRGAAISAVLKTDGDGRYAFAGLPPGVYAIDQTQPPGFIDGKDHLGTLGGTVGPDQFFDIDLLPARFGFDYDFGELLPDNPPVPPLPPFPPAPSPPTVPRVDVLDQYFLSLAQNSPARPPLARRSTGEVFIPGLLSGTVFIDANDNGRLDRDGSQGEQGIADVAVDLEGWNRNGGRVTRTAVTDQRGYYEFLNLAPGEYGLVRRPLLNFVPGRNHVGNVNGLPSGNSPSDDAILDIRLTRAAVGTQYDFGELVPASLRGQVLVGLGTDAEPAPLGMELVLEGTDSAGRQVRKTARTNFYGGFRFERLPPGEYRVRLETPKNLLLLTSTAGNKGGSASADQSVGKIELGQGDCAFGYDFRVVEVTPSPVPAAAGR